MGNKTPQEEDILEIETSVFQRIKSRSNYWPFELNAEPWLISELSGNYGALFIRAMLYYLQVDEHHVLKWRLENKYKQYEVFEYYNPGSCPRSISLCSLLTSAGGVQKVKDLFNEGYFLKSTLGDASYSTHSWDKSWQLEQIIQQTDICEGRYERFMLQKKLQIQSEFRIHTFCKDIIPSLTFLIQGNKQYRDGAEEFLNNILPNFPDAILEGTMIGWDVALTYDSQFHIIEANFTGFHPKYRKGFQTSGFFDNHRYGPIICAWVNTFFRKNYGVYADSVGQDLFAQYPFYRAFIYYFSIFKDHHIDLVRKNKKSYPLNLIIYLGEDNNTPMVRLIEHFLLVDFADKYFVIVQDKYINKIYSLFNGNDRLVLWAESWLFTKEQYEAVNQMGYLRKKSICCYHASRRNKSCTIL